MCYNTADKNERGARMAFFSGGNDRIKLITLYILKAFRAPITWEQLYTALAYQNGPGFFECGELYNELAAEGFIVSVPAKDRQLVSLTEKGAETCELFKNEIAKSVRESVDRYAEENREAFKRGNCVLADASPLPGGAWELTLALLDNGGSLFEMRMRMPNAAYARRAMDYWNAHSDEMYLRLMKEMTE